MANKFCMECGSPLGENARFCPQCGTPVGGTAAAAGIHQAANVNKAPEKVCLRIRRSSSFVGAAVPIHITLNGGNIGSLSVGKSMEIVAPTEPFSLEFEQGFIKGLNPVKRSVYIDPSKCKMGIIECNIGIKMANLFTSDVNVNVQCM